MPRRFLVTIGAVLVAATALRADVRARPVESTNRTIFVSATDGKGGPIADLTAADLVVKEGGKEREVVRVEPAPGRMHLVLAAEDRIVGDGSIRLGMFEFAKRVAKAADIRLVTMGLTDRTLVDFTPDVNTVLGAINKLTLNPSRDSNLNESILEILNGFTTAGVERPVLVVVALSGGQAGVDPRNVLDRLAASGAIMHSVTLDGGAANAGVESMSDQSGREQVLGDGPKQSGGRRHDLTVPAAVPKALQQVADDLLAQYAITYVLPDGVKPNKRVSVSTKRRGVALRAPTAIPER